MIEQINKGVTFYLLVETGQPNRLFFTRTEAQAAYVDPLLGAERSVVECRIVAKKVQVVEDREVA